MKKDDRFSSWEWSFLEVLWKRRAYPKWGRSVFLSTADILDIASGGFTYPKEAKGNKKPIGFYVSELLQKCGIPNKHRTNGGKRWQTVALRKFLRDLFSEGTGEEEPFSDPEDPTLAAYGESEERAKHFRALFVESQSELARYKTLLHVYAHLDNPRPPPPKFLSSQREDKKSSEHEVVFCSILSDTHFSEVVEPAHVNGVNAYNRTIADIRLKTYFEKIVWIIQSYIHGVRIKGLVICLGGDILSGIIHEELRETNERRMLEEAMFWADQIASGLIYLTKKLGIPIYCPAVVGNHGRLTKKPVYKYRAEDNLDYLVYLMCERAVANSPESQSIVFDISRSTEVSFSVYQTRYILCHGDEFRGGRGISGIYTPISLGRMRKQERGLSLGQPYDVLLMGHFHQLVFGGNFIINGSLIGTNEFAFMQSMRVEPPQQAFWLSTPRGITMFGPIFVEGENEQYKHKDFYNVTQKK
jgi:predicted phosphodiesterase